MRLLVVEDEDVLADAVARGLRREGHAVDVVYDGAAAIDAAALTRYDVVVLDRDLPVVHGDDVCAHLLLADETPRILMVTAAGAPGDRVEGLHLGADDYLAKPFVFAELTARVAALGRRTARSRPPVIRAGDLELDTGQRTARRGTRDLNLTPKEFAVLQILLEADGALVSAEELLERAWDLHADPFSHVVRTVMVGLRRKLGEPGVITVRGAGYRLALR